MIKNLLFISLTFFRLYSSAQNFIATYGFADVTTTTGTLDPGTPPQVSGLTMGSFSAVGTSSNPGASGRFSFTGWPLGAINATDDYSNFTGVLSPTVYYEVSLSVNPGYTLSLSSASFTVRRSSSGIRHYCVRSSLDNYINNLAAATGTNTKLSVIPGDVFFWNYDSVSTASDQRGSQVSFGSTFGAITNSVAFRIYAWNAESGGGSFSIDNFSFAGSVSNTTTLPDPLGLPATQLSSGGITIFPNPGPGRNIQVNAGEDITRIEVFSAAGNRVFTKIPDDAQQSIFLEMPGLGSGVYFVKVCAGAGFALKKIVLLPE